MRWAFLGRIEYARALALQERLRAAIVAGDGAAEALLLLEHPPVITLGRSARREHVLLPEAELARRGVALAHVGRGGDVTYHGPGQLVGYPVRRVGRQVREHVRAIADAIVAALAGWRVDAWWRAETPGVWCSAGKIAALGIDARGGVAIHGFALNLETELDAYRMIVPCGLAAPVTSVAALLGPGRAPTLREAARTLAGLLSARLGSEPRELEELAC